MQETVNKTERPFSPTIPGMVNEPSNTFQKTLRNLRYPKELYGNLRNSKETQGTLGNPKKPLETARKPKY